MNKSINYQKILNILIDIIIISMSMLIILKMINLPIHMDDWVYGSSISLSPIFFSGVGMHPGRHISEALHIVPVQILGKNLGIILGDSLLAVKIMSFIINTLAIYGCVMISSFYIDLKNKKNIFCILLILLYPLLNFFITTTQLSQVLGGFNLALLVWLPFYQYCCNGKLSSIFLENEYATYGIMFVLLYMGTQVTDSSYFALVSLSMMLVAYISGQKFLPQFFEKNNNTSQETRIVLVLLFMHILYGCYAFFRNTVMAPSQYGFRKGGMNFSVVEIINRIKDGPFLQDLSIVFGGIIILYYLYKFITNRKITLKEYLSFSVCVSALFWIVVLSIMGTYKLQVLWILWLCELNILINLYKNNNKIVQLIMPIILFGIFINIFIQEQEYQKNTPSEFYRRDKILIEYFEDVQLNNTESVIIPSDLADKMRLRKVDHTVWPLRDISHWMKYHNYTDEYIPITFSSNQ